MKRKKYQPTGEPLTEQDWATIFGLRWGRHKTAAKVLRALKKLRDNNNEPQLASALWERVEGEYVENRLQHMNVVFTKQAPGYRIVKYRKPVRRVKGIATSKWLNSYRICKVRQILPTANSDP